MRGSAIRRQNEIELMNSDFREVIDLSRANRDLCAELAALISKGLSRIDFGDSAEALKMMGSSLKISRQPNGKLMEGNCP
jgi:hypothetical protein